MQYDVFISYRRATGKDYARIIKPELTTRGLKVFLDLDELKDGKFDKRILEAIESAPVFMIILSPGMLDRCVNEDDWVRQEILHAENCKKQIIPVEVDKSFRSIPEQVPEDIKKIVGQHQFSQVDTETLLKVSMDELVQVRIQPYLGGDKVSIANRGAEIHIESDSTCEVFRYSEKLGIAQKGDDTVFRLHKGTQKLVFRSLKFENAKVEKILKIPDEVYTDFVKVEIAFLEQDIERKKEEEHRKREEQNKILAEAERKRLERKVEVRKDLKLRNDRVTIKPALWHRWLAWFINVVLGVGIGVYSYFSVLMNEWWTVVICGLAYSWYGYLMFHFIKRGSLVGNLSKEYFMEDWYVENCYYETVAACYMIDVLQIIVFLLIISIVSATLSVVLYILFSYLYRISNNCFLGYCMFFAFVGIMFVIGFQCFTFIVRISEKKHF